MMPSVSRPGDMQSVQGPSPEATNRVVPFIGPMSASFQVNAPGAPPGGDLETAEAYGQRVSEITLQFVRGRRV
jgi:hypothetical protein